MLKWFLLSVSLLLKVSHQKNERRLLVLPSDENDTFDYDHIDDKVGHKEAIEMVVTNEIQTCSKNFR